MHSDFFFIRCVISDNAATPLLQQGRPSHAHLCVRVRGPRFPRASPTRAFLPSTAVPGLCIGRQRKRTGSSDEAPTTRGICGQYTPAGAPCLRKSSLSGSVGAKFAGDGWHEAAIRAKADHSGLHIVPPARRFWNSFAPQSRFANDGSEPIIGSAHDGNAYSDYYYGISSWDGGSGGTTATGYYYLHALVPRCTCRGRVVHATRIHACRPP